MASKGKGNGKTGAAQVKAAAEVVKAIAADLKEADANATDALKHRLLAGERIANRGKGVSFKTLSAQLKAVRCKAHGTSVQPLNHMAQVHTAFIAPKAGAVTLATLAKLGAQGVGIQKLQAWVKVAEAEGPKHVVSILEKDPTAKPPRAKASSTADRILISLTSTEDVAAFRSLAEGDEKPAATLKRLMAEIIKRRAADTPATRKGGSKRERATLPDRPQA